MRTDSRVARADERSLQLLTSSLGPTFGAAGRAITELSLALIGLYFLLLNGDAVHDALRRWLPFSRAASDSLAQDFVAVTRSTTLGSLASAGAQGASIGFGMWLTGNEAPVFWATAAAFATLVPIVGNAIVWVPATVAALISRDYTATALMFVFGRVVPEVLDRTVKSRISRHQSSTHPMITLTGVLIGVQLFGVVGLLVGPALLHCTLESAELYRREYGLGR